jgi:hypothetical protein
MDANTTAVPAETGSVALPGVWALLKESLTFYKKNWKKIFAIGMPGIIFGFAYFAAYLLSIFFWIFGTIFLLALIAFYIFSANFTISLIAFFKNAEGVDSAKQLRAQGWSYFWPSALVLLLTVLAGALGMALLVVPGIIIAIRLAFSQFVLITENKRGLSALGRSWYLVRGNGWKVFWRQFVLGLLIFLINVILLSIVAIIAAILVLELGKHMWGLLIIVVTAKALQALYGAIAYLVLAPFSLIYSYKMYQAISVAKEANEAEEAKYAKKIKILAWLSPVALIVLVALLIILSALVPPPRPHVIPQSGVTTSTENGVPLPLNNNL